MINPNSGRKTDAKVKGDLFDAMLYYQEPSDNKTSEVIWDYPEILVELLNQFQKLWNIPEMAIPSKKQKGKYDNWVLQLESLRKLFSSDARMKIAMKYTYEKYEKNEHKPIIYEPISIYKILVDAIAELKREEKRQKLLNEAKENTPLASSESIKKTVKDLKNFLKTDEE